MRRHGDHKIRYLRRLDVLRTNLHLVLLLRHLDRSRREVQVIRRNYIAHLLNRQTIRIQFLLVDIDIDVAVRRTRKGDISDTVHLVELRNDLVIKDLIQTCVGLVGRDRVLRNRHSGRREFEDHWRSAVVRQVRFGHIDIRPHVVDGFVHISAPLQLEHHHGHIILTLRSNMLEVIDRGKGVLHELRHVRFHLRCRRTRIGRHDRDVRRVHLRKHVHRQLHEAIYTDHDHRHKDQGGRYRFLNRCFINCHKFN